jgi:hypothetical protein
MKRTDTKTLISAARILSRDIQSEDGVANAALAEIADRLEELEKKKIMLRYALQDMVDAGIEHYEMSTGELGPDVIEAAEVALGKTK